MTRWSRRSISYPTLLEYVGIEARNGPEGGMSFSNHLDEPSSTGRDKIFAEYAFVRTVRTANHKWVERAEGFEPELFDLDKDPDERRDLADDPAYAAVKARLRDEMASWFAAPGAPPLERWRETQKVEMSPYEIRGKP